jgi:hypothetical protein
MISALMGERHISGISFPKAEGGSQASHRMML